MTSKDMRVIPESVLRRLFRYHYQLQGLDRDGVVTISSKAIASYLEVEPILVRKDLQYTGVVGKPKMGYIIKELILGIEDVAGWNDTKDAFLVGAGQLGKTLLVYTGFENYGLNFRLAFDNSPEVIGTDIDGVKIIDVEKMVELAKRMHIKVGVLTVPANVAQAVTEKMLEGGILAIWNFTSAHIKVPSEIIVVNGMLSQEIAILGNRLSQMLKDKLKDKLTVSSNIL